MTAAFQTARRVLLVALAGLAATTLVTGVATAATSDCGKQVIGDWYDNGRIDKIYPLRCYDQAIKQLPNDVIDYTNASEDIARARSFASRGKPDPGDTTARPTTPTQTSTDPSPTEPRPTTPTGTEPDETETEPDETETSGGFTQAGPDEPTGSDPSSVPVPLLVLGGLALLLMAAGGAGYLARRFGGSDAGGPTIPS